ncbi:hypothetical protein MLD38_034821 [Melastoma candidum]|uniref:Uncharacterized protein n=1 Tax=Melastoma candidum TaxID=119954 RepID=A0ACB9MBP5_9MYRT|nr:hypothetical protein MLD38_034821 [Melastoma candidum]
MVSMKKADRNPVYGAKLSSVVPASVTGDYKVRHELADQDLALKLHYIKGVYVFREDAVRGLSIYDLKKPMFCWLDLFPAASGRIRRGEDDSNDSFPGRPFVKCNDSGVRIVEARCELTVDEWLSGTEEGLHSPDTLAYDQVLGPDLGFSPLVYVQVKGTTPSHLFLL